MQPSVWPAGWMPTQVENPRRKRHLQPASQSPALESRENENFCVTSPRFATREQMWRGSPLLRVPCHVSVFCVGTGTHSLGGISPTTAPKVCGCGVLP